MNNTYSVQWTTSLSVLLGLAVQEGERKTKEICNKMQGPGNGAL